MSNFFSNIPSNLPAELKETLIQSNGVRIDGIVSHGHAPPDGFWYDQQAHEWVSRASFCFAFEIHMRH
jgi:cupin 2 domain-containing protein